MQQSVCRHLLKYHPAASKGKGSFVLFLCTLTAVLSYHRPDQRQYKHSAEIMCEHHVYFTAIVRHLKHQRINRPYQNNSVKDNGVDEEHWRRKERELERVATITSMHCRFTDLSALYVDEMEKRMVACLQRYKLFFKFPRTRPP